MGSIITIGVFDGLHMGHQEIIETVIDKGYKENLTPIIITMSPAPCYYYSAFGTKVINTLSQNRIEALKSYNIKTICYAYSHAFEQLSPEEFVLLFLRDTNAKEVVVGDDHRFGHKSIGDVVLLEKLSKKYNFKLTVIESKEKAKYSSTSMRALMQKGDVHEITKTRGHVPLSISGISYKGKRYASSIGIPTANIHTEMAIAPGIYASITYHYEYNDAYHSCSYVDNNCIETHFIDKEFGDLYAHKFAIQILEYIRPKIHITDPVNLNHKVIKQYNDDIRNVKRYYKELSKSA